LGVWLKDFSAGEDETEDEFDDEEDERVRKEI